ncbi:hypothetical protein PV355_09955 [Streptomyces stelliscabiei]|uniref:hypothetical protein n=1 Tax=Streptomyces stelliscabiei TaxID=146820 RepID=UPI0029BBA2B2|nr:hypothetical protein [Streptomyces stelliscabiei]MDX2515463.1 hypothetical protein [Streptomyces stelliscabiei]
MTTEERPQVLGRADGTHLVALCPYCRTDHVHGRGTGPVTADCLAPGSERGYTVIDPAAPTGKDQP